MTREFSVPPSKRSMQG
nr:unnamed protein product [Callosobruchus chinensis]